MAAVMVVKLGPNIYHHSDLQSSCILPATSVLRLTVAVVYDDMSYTCVYQKVLLHYFWAVRLER